jgi:hypothetical protein
MDADTPRTGRLDNRRDVSGVIDRAVGLPPVIAQRPSRDDGHPVIALLAVYREMLISELAEGSARKCVVGALGLLQTQDIGLFGLEKMLNQRKPEPDGVDIPGRNGKRQIEIALLMKTSLYLAD